ncbi:IspD/TarI family cytidylyltransferase [Anaerofustis sp.]|uniref:IspD/TarI family cytidylyltransferase n=1 Tax=Anaerofustis sp. TaxID=1872517 RepID=UPI0025BA47DF|nr:IspD/TarI family cytidylyltransferase [Anaerofustis sp.]
MNIGLILAGGKGSRMGKTTVPKQFLYVKDKPIIVHTIDIFEKCKDIDGVVIVCNNQYISYMKDLINEFDLKKVIKIVENGETAHESVFNGLTYIHENFEKENPVVVVHDGVRPFITEEIVSNNIKVVRETGRGVSTAYPVVETIMKVEDEKVREIYPRDLLQIGQAPQSFIGNELYELNKRAMDEGRVFIDQASVYKYYKGDLEITMGSRLNIKITTIEDYHMAKFMYDIKNELI